MTDLKRSVTTGTVEMVWKINLQSPNPDKNLTIHCKLTSRSINNQQIRCILHLLLIEYPVSLGNASYYRSKMSFDSHFIYFNAGLCLFTVVAVWVLSEIWLDMHHWPTSSFRKSTFTQIQRKNKIDFHMLLIAAKKCIFKI